MQIGSKTHSHPLGNFQCNPRWRTGLPSLISHLEHDVSLANRCRGLNSSTVRLELANFQGSLIKARQQAFLLLSLHFPQCELLAESAPLLTQGSPEGLEDPCVPIPSHLTGDLRSSLQKCLWAGSPSGPAEVRSCLMAY